MADTTDSIYNNIPDFFGGIDDGGDEDGGWDYDDGLTDEERAIEILTELEDKPSLMREFNLLLRQRKIEQLNKK